MQYKESSKDSDNEFEPLNFDKRTYKRGREMLIDTSDDDYGLDSLHRFLGTEES